MNKQPIERRVMDPSGTLDVHSIFFTFQGEGPFAGTPCVFVRLGGCNLQCPGCDTIYTDKPGDKYKRRLYTAHELVKAVVDCELDHGDPYPSCGRLVVITGGEPFRQNIGLFINKLIATGHFVQVESNGTLAPSLDVAWGRAEDVGKREGAYLVTSPKTGKMSLGHRTESCAFKYVMAYDSVDPEDGLPIYALAHDTGKRVARPPQGVPVYLQPMDHTMMADADGMAEFEANRASVKAVLQSCLKHGYIFQLQIHKLAGVE
jgi:7-carboxy-7-deazaguanine synthase